MFAVWPETSSSKRNKAGTDSLMTSRAVDFLVIGGGPAGSAFGTLAARAGASVVIVERDDFQRHRPGEHLAGSIRPLLDALGVALAYESGIATSSPGIVTLWSGDQPPLLKHYGAIGRARGLCVVRQRFDELLFCTAEQAGATVLSRTAPGVIERQRNGAWTASFSRHDGRIEHYTARSIVDASGRSAVFARRQGSRRINHGDAIAIVRWLDVSDFTPSAGEPLTVESCAFGWWSLSVVGDHTLVATLYTSSGMMKSAGATPDDWWELALSATRPTQDIVRRAPTEVRATRVASACPSLASTPVGNGWIAVGDAAIALDPLGGQGVAFALETAFRAFEAARVDPSWAVLGEVYDEALRDRFAAHLAGRLDVYAEAAGVLAVSFFNGAVGADSVSQV